MMDPLERNLERLIREGYEPLRPGPQLERDLLPRMHQWQDQLRSRRRRFRILSVAAAAAALLVAVLLTLAFRPRVSREVASTEASPAPAPAPKVALPPPPQKKEAPAPEPPRLDVPAPAEPPAPPPAPAPSVPGPVPPSDPDPVPTPLPVPPDPAPDRRSRAAVARLEAVKGQVFVVDAGRRVKARPGADLLSSQTVEVEVDSQARLALPDGTSVQLAPSSVAVLDDGAVNIVLERGALTARVAKRPREAPLRVRTAQAEVTVLGTVFAVTCAPEATRVEVVEGLVRLARSEDAATLDLGPLTFAVAARGIPLSALPLPPDRLEELDPRVELAIKRGLSYLKAAHAEHLSPFQQANHGGMYYAELVLWTFLHADIPEDDARFKELLANVLERKLERTYTVALQAMVLEELDRVKHQPRIWQCAQFLVDNQSADGYWGYGEPTPFSDRLPNSVPTAGKTREFVPGPRVKPAVVRKLKVAKNRDVRGNDTSNTQYAVLGLRACHDAGIVIPGSVIDRGIEWLRTSQAKDGVPEASLVEGVRKKIAPQGWAYVPDQHRATGSMTAGAAGSLSVLLSIRDNDEGKKKSWKQDVDILQGLQWMGKYFAPDRNPSPFEPDDPRNKLQHLYYYFYAVERLGALYGTEQLGAHRWYPECLPALLDSQKADGSWGGGPADTCFAILFLRRATRPLEDVASVDPLKPYMK